MPFTKGARETSRYIWKKRGEKKRDGKENDERKGERKKGREEKSKRQRTPCTNSQNFSSDLARGTSGQIQ